MERVLVLARDYYVDVDVEVEVYYDYADAEV